MPGRGWWFQSVGSLTMYKSGTRFIVSANTPWIHSDMYLWINKIVTILMINISTNYLLEMRVGRKTFLLPSQVWFLGNCELNWQKSYISSLMLIFLRDWKLHRKEVKNQRSIWTSGPLGFPWHSGKESSWECSRHKRCGFDPLLGKIPGVGNGNPLQYSCLENSMNRGAWRATGHGAAESQIWLSAHTRMIKTIQTTEATEHWTPTFLFDLRD